MDECERVGVFPSELVHVDAIEITQGRKLKNSKCMCRGIILNVLNTFRGVL